MTVRRLTAVAISLVAIGLCANVAAAGNVPRTGDQKVGLVGCAYFGGPCGDLYLRGNEAFYVAHGFSGESKADLLNPRHRFELSVDGNPIQGALDLDLSVLSKVYVFNFRFGLTGNHSFTGCWYKTDGAVDACATRVVHFV